MLDRRLLSEADEERSWTCRTCDTLIEDEGSYCRACTAYWEDVSGLFDWPEDLSGAEAAD